jgi:hypothetical protein
MDPLVSYEENKGLRIRPKNVLVLHYTRLEKVVRDKQSSLLIPFVSYGESKALRIRPKNVLVLHYTRLERVVRDKQSSLLDPFVTYGENKVLRWLKIVCSTSTVGPIS